MPRSCRGYALGSSYIWAVYRLLKHREIDRKRWMSCVESDPAPLLYSCDWMLDAAAPGWAALVRGNYEAVLPLPMSRRWGLGMVHQPVGLHLLRWHGRECGREDDRALLRALDGVAFAGINYAPVALDAEVGELRSLQRMPLQPESALLSHYKGSLLRSIKKSEKYNLQLARSDSMADLSFVVKHSPAMERMGRGVKPHKLEALCAALVKLPEGRLYIAHLNGQPCAALVMVGAYGTVYTIVSLSTKDGYEACATHALKHFSLCNSYDDGYTAHDFGGSAIPSIARFNKGFGGEDLAYRYCERGWLKPVLKRWLERR